MVRLFSRFRKVGRFGLQIISAICENYYFSDLFNRNNSSNKSARVSFRAIIITQRRSSASQHMTKKSIYAYICVLTCTPESIVHSIKSEVQVNNKKNICVYIQHFNCLQCRPYGAVVNTYAVQAEGRWFESLRLLAFF